MTVAGSRALFHEALRNELPLFVWKVFETLHPEGLPNRGWYIDAMCHALAGSAEGRTRRVLITLPPRHLKSITVSVAFVAWMMGKDPRLKFLVASYGADLASGLSRQFRQVVTSAWYREVFPRFRLARQAEDDLTTTLGGARKAVSVKGPTTGFGADYIIVDDLMNFTDAAHPALRQAALDYFRGGLISRLNDPEHGRVIVVAQRLHEDDLPGLCIETGIYKHLCLPAIAVKDELIELGGGDTIERKVGDLLSPARLSRERLKQIRLEQGDAYYFAQYQQDPSPSESIFLHWPDVRFYEEAPSRSACEKIVQSWDTADTTNPHSDYSVCTTYGYLQGAWWVLDCDRFKAPWRELLDRCRATRDRWRPDLIIIEEHGAGRTLLDELRNERLTSPKRQSMAWKLVPYRPRAGKVERWAAQAHKLTTGSVLLPRRAPWLEAFRKEATAFPNGRHDDMIDSMSQFLEYTTWGRTARSLERERHEPPGDRRMPVVRSSYDDVDEWGLKRRR